MWLVNWQDQLKEKIVNKVQTAANQRFKLDSDQIIESYRTKVAAENKRHLN